MGCMFFIPNVFFVLFHIFFFCVMVFLEKLEASLFYHPAMIAFIFFFWVMGGGRYGGGFRATRFPLMLAADYLGVYNMVVAVLLCLAVEGMNYEENKNVTFSRHHFK